MEENNKLTKQIKISYITKRRIDIMKGKRTYEKFFDEVLGYFEMTGVDPRYNYLPPAVTIVKAIKEETASIFKRIEDSIKILRNIETNKIDPLIHSTNTHLSGNFLKKEEEEIGASEEEIFQLIQINEKNEQIIFEQKKYISELEKEIKILKNNSDAQIIIGIVEELLSDKILDKIGDGNFILTKIHRNQLIQKIKTYSNV